MEYCHIPEGRHDQCSIWGTLDQMQMTLIVHYLTLQKEVLAEQQLQA
jgi:hypothetical protein